MARKNIERGSSDSRISKLQRMANGGTPHERAIAQDKLKKFHSNSRELATPESEESGDIWLPIGNLVRVRKGSRAFMRGPTLSYFLDHLKDGQTFNNRTIPLTEQSSSDGGFGTGDFYTILSWLLKNGLVEKNGSRYTLHNRKEVVNAWNRQVDAMRLS